MFPDISIIIATYNREKDLAITLESIVKAAKGDQRVEIIVVDNGSTDQTKLIINSYTNRIKIQYIFEPRQGKNKALNTVIEKVNLGKIVVFTDDDVNFSPNWLNSIQSICNRWPKHSVFGGKINVVFPPGEVPKWASDPNIAPLAFVHHDYSKEECVYRGFDVPFGPNYWVKREVFNSGIRFDERMGPHPKNRIMGDETFFLLTLLNEGYEIVYSPATIVEHRVQPSSLKFHNVPKRAYQWGRGKIYIYGLPQQKLLMNHSTTWHFYRYAAIAWNMFKIILAIIFPFKENTQSKCIINATALGYQIEALKEGKNYRERQRKHT